MALFLSLQRLVFQRQGCRLQVVSALLLLRLLLMWAVTGSTSTGSVDSVTVTGTANYMPSGSAGTGAAQLCQRLKVMRLLQKRVLLLQASVGSVTVAANADVGVTGIAATGGLDSVTVQGTANVPETGLAATGGVGALQL